MSNELLCFLRIIMTPSCWIRNRSTNKQWDRMVLSQLKTPHFTENDNYTVMLNGVQMWVENYPYAYGTDYTGLNDGMPSRATVFRLKDALDRAKT